MLLLCYMLCTLTHPGEIPSDDPKWDYKSTPNPDIKLKEKKKTGERRHCKWCGKYKPDRAHHCRVCRCCILRMDHHSPWIGTCVGEHNHKFFILTLFYGTLAIHWVFWTLVPHAYPALTETSFLGGVLVLFALAVALILGGVVSMFTGFHFFLIAKGMTTIDFCEGSQAGNKRQ